MSALLQFLLNPLHRLNHILAMAEVRRPEASLPAWAEAGAGGADHVACDTVNVEERRFHVCASRNSIRKHKKSQWSTAEKPKNLLYHISRLCRWQSFQCPQQIPVRCRIPGTVYLIASQQKPLGRFHKLLRYRPDLGDVIGSHLCFLHIIALLAQLKGPVQCLRHLLWERSGFNEFPVGENSGDSILNCPLAKTARQIPQTAPPQA
jgi:hypothetical protein